MPTRLTESSPLAERDFSADERKRLAAEGQALPDGSFPIVTVGDLENAIQAYGRAGDKAAAKRHIMKRARALGRADLIPEEWHSGDMSEAAGTPLIEAARIVEAAPGGREWDVILIEPGVSKNGRYYPPATLAAAAPLFEGAYSYARHRAPGEGERHPHDKVGRFSQVRATEAGLVARFKAIAPWVRELLREAMEGGEPDFVGFSIDATGRVVRREHDGRAVAWVEAITAVNSVDLVAEPAAGGRLVRLVASAETAESDRTMDPEEITRLIGEQVATAVAAAVPTIVEAVRPAAPPTTTAAATPEQAVATATTGDDPAALAEAHRSLINAARIREALSASPTLSEPGRALVRRDLEHRGERALLSEEACTARVTEQVDYEAALRPVLAESIGGERTRIGLVPAEKIHKALQGWFTGEPVDGIAPLRSLREGYRRLNGIDADDLDFLEFAESFVCQYKGHRTHERLQESLTTATWGQIFADVLYLRLIAEYQRMLEIMDWRLVCSDIVPVEDFRTYHYARVGGYADLATVGEGATYPTLTTPGDEEQTFSVAKRGGMDDWTLEAAANDKTNKVRQLPRLMADASLRTLYKFVMNLITTDNPTLGYDSVALYDAAHGNTGTTALSVSGLNVTQIAMRDQSPFGNSNELLSARNKIRYLITPNELEARAERIVMPSPEYTFALSSSADTDTQLDPARWRNKGVRPITYDYLTDATDWWAVADPALVPTVVMGFLNGRQEPELFMQDREDSDTMFNADKTRAKVRQIYGGAVLDHRSFYRQVVA